DEREALARTIKRQTVVAALQCRRDDDGPCEWQRAIATVVEDEQRSRFSGVVNREEIPRQAGWLLWHLRDGRWLIRNAYLFHWWIQQGSTLVPLTLVFPPQWRELVGRAHGIEKVGGRKREACGLQIRTSRADGMAGCQGGVAGRRELIPRANEGADHAGRVSI